MEIQQYITLIKRWFWLIILGGLVAAGAAFIISKTQEPVYRASSLLLISEGAAPNSGGEFQAFQLSERLAQSYIERLTNYEVLTEAIGNLGLTMDPDALHNAMQASLVNNSQLIALSIEDTNPQVAAALANEIPTVFANRNMTMQLERFANSKANLETELAEIKAELASAEAVLAAEKSNGNEQIQVEQLTDNLLRLRETHSKILQSYEDIRVAEAGSLNNIIIDEHARIPTQPISPRTVTNTLLAGVVGVMLAVGVVFLIEYLDDTVKDPDSMESVTGLSTIGIIPKYTPRAENEKLVMEAQPRSPDAEAYRQARTNVQYVGVSQDLATILITSANANEGKSTTAANLAIALAQADSKVVLIDTDLRRPSLHHKFNVPNNMGLTNLLLSKENDVAFIQETETPNLRLITSGPLPPNPAELIHSARMKDIFDWLHEEVDYLVLDSPPVLAVTDAVLLSQLASTTLIVVEAGKTRQQSLLLAARQIEAVNGHIAGLIINKINPRRSGYYYNYYYQSNYHYLQNDNQGGKRKQKLGSMISGFFASVLSLMHIS